MNDLQIETTAMICYQAEREWCRANGEAVQPRWHDALSWQRSSAMLGVMSHLANPAAIMSESHDSWVKQKRDDGWAYGEVEDPAKRTHPAIVPYKKLPTDQRMKDFLFRGIVLAMRDCYGAK